ncbi:hypothetical protein [Enterobacter roggenkampii]|nr:hypothetical protein [Enterobacter roggenkampii]
MTLTTIPRPIDSIQKVFSELKPSFYEVHFMKNEKCIIKSTENLFFLSSGQITLVSDGFSTRIKAPVLFGLVGCFGFLTTLHFRATDNVVAYTANTAEALSLIKKNDLWEDIGKIIAFNSAISQYVYSHMRDPYKTTQYKIAKAIENINELQNNNNTALFLAKEIMSLTSLSRSVVMKNISFLKDNNIIDIKNGRLIFLDRDKLEKYYL